MPSRAERAEEVRRLHDREGLNGLQIAARLGISRSFAYELLADPEGVKTKARKAKAGGTCVDCGTPTAYRTGGPAERCVPCYYANCEARAKWTREKVIEWIRNYVAEHGVVPPSTVQVRMRSAAPHTSATQRIFGSNGWRTAVREAGYEPYRDHPGTGHQLGEDHPTVQEMLDLHEQGWSGVEIAERQGVTPSAIYLRLKRWGKVAA